MSVADGKNMRSALIRKARRDGARACVVKKVAAEFKIADVDGLRDVIDFAAEIYQRAEFDSQQGREREVKQLKQLDKPLSKTLELLRELRSPIIGAASRRYYGEAALVRENYGNVALGYTDLLDQLEEIGDVARGLPRRGRKQGEHKARGGIDLKPLRELTSVLAGYWRGRLGREFHQNQNELGWDVDGIAPSDKAHEAVRFCYEAIEHIAPGQGVFLKTIAREYNGDAYSK